MNKRTKWNDALLVSELEPICKGLGHFPSASTLSSLGRGDIMNQLTRRGGYVAWAERLGYKRLPSDSDTGWAGEDRAVEILTTAGFETVRQRKTAPFDITVNGCVRIDVKTAVYAEYSIKAHRGACRGWFYRIAKVPTADVLMLYQLDTGVAYYIPWTLCPTTNITIARDGGKYSRFRNNLDVLHQLVSTRSVEAVVHQSLIE